MRLIAAIIVAALCLSVSAAAQEVAGPPVPGVRAPTASGPQVAPTGQGAKVIDLNPLEVLDAAGAAAAGAGGGVTGSAAGGAGRTGLSTAVSIMLLLTVISLAPAIVLMTTCFMRMIIVLGLLKQALGTQTVPPPQVITALTLFMTLLVMTPTLERINKEAIAPYRSGEITDYTELWERGKQPIRDFMFAQIEATGNWSSVYMVLNYRGVDTSDPSKLTRTDVDMTSLIPAYMLSEMRTAFLMGFRVYLPFLVIDMVISSLLISMSMMMLPPVLISLPFKLLLFVLVDGWQLIVGGLMTSFVQPDAASAVTAMLDPLRGDLAAVLSAVIASRC
jgi:flagellar biosynthetic protein FliP